MSAPASSGSRCSSTPPSTRRRCCCSSRFVDRAAAADEERHEGHEGKHERHEEHELKRFVPSLIVSSSCPFVSFVPLVSSVSTRHALDCVSRCKRDCVQSRPHNMSA